ncbi:MAG: GYF domain-containing protein [Thermoguttaceae bacterium]|jgi:hypothetical protein
MADQWYYAQKGQRQGPVSEEQLKELASTGQLKPNDKVWKQGMAQWAKAIEVFPPAVPAPPVSPDPNVPPPIPSHKTPGGRLWKILVFSGVGLLLISFFLPWWGITLRKPDSIGKVAEMANWGIGKETRMQRVVLRNQNWYESHRVYFEDLAGEMVGGSEATSRIWGWQTGLGITGLIFSLIILSLAITPIFVAIIQNWSWIGSFITAILGIITLILALVWLFGTPSEDVRPILFQGPSIGPYPYLVGSLLILGGSITEGILGLMAFIRSMGFIRSFGTV